MVIFHSYVKLPEGKPPFSHGFPVVYIPTEPITYHPTEFVRYIPTQTLTLSWP